MRGRWPDAGLRQLARANLPVAVHVAIYVRCDDHPRDPTGIYSWPVSGEAIS
jgi:hypothetical protein